MIYKLQQITYAVSLVGMASYPEKINKCVVLN